MDSDSRARAAEYYDLQPHNPDDIEFYRERLPSADSRVLELGCGTGRVLVPLIESCRFIYGLDNSQAMLSICQRKIDRADFQPDKARAEFSDITNFDLGEKFDLITAPFRVLQNLDSDAQVFVWGFGTLLPRTGDPSLRALRSTVTRRLPLLSRRTL